MVLEALTVFIAFSWHFVVLYCSLTWWHTGGLGMQSRMNIQLMMRILLKKQHKLFTQSSVFNSVECVFYIWSEVGSLTQLAQTDFELLQSFCPSFPVSWTYRCVCAAMLGSFFLFWIRLFSRTMAKESGLHSDWDGLNNTPPKQFHRKSLQRVDTFCQLWMRISEELGMMAHSCNPSSWGSEA